MTTAFKKILAIILVMGLFASAFAQNHRFQRDVDRLQSGIERIESLLNSLPGIRNSDYGPQIISLLNSAKQNIEQAKLLQQQNKPVQARMALQEAWALIRQIQMQIKQIPVLKFKFQEQLDQKINEIEGLLNSQPNDEAFYFLNRAKFYRQQAYRLFSQDDLFEAMEYYRLSLHFAEQALKVFKHSDRGNLSFERVQQQYLDTELLLNRLQAKIGDVGADNSQFQILKNMEKELNSAKRLINQREFSAAQQHLLGINRVLYRMLENVEKLPTTDDGQLTIELQTIQFTVAQLEQSVSEEENPAAAKLLERTKELVNRSEILLRQKKMVQARRNLLFANQILAKIYRMLDRRERNQPALLENQLARTRQQINASKAESVENEAAKPLLDLIESNFQKAQSRYAEGDLQQAAAYLSLTNQFLLQLQKLKLIQTGEAINRQRVKGELLRFEQMLSKLAAEADGDSEYQIRYENAQKIYDLAKKLFEDDRLKESRELIRMGMNIMTSADVN
jgi:hypothetical protein